MGRAEARNTEQETPELAGCSPRHLLACSPSRRPSLGGKMLHSTKLSSSEGLMLMSLAQTGYG